MFSDSLNQIIKSLNIPFVKTLSSSNYSYSYTYMYELDDDQIYNLLKLIFEAKLPFSIFSEKFGYIYRFHDNLCLIFYNERHTFYNEFTNIFLCNKEKDILKYYKLMEIL